jgi:thiamine biosynthesis lipoprotein
VDLWQNAKNKSEIPDSHEIETVLRLVNYQDIELNGSDQTVFLPVVGMRLDLGGIAKGYAVESAVSILKGAGIVSGLVSAGGNIYALGYKPDGSAWRVGIRDPLDIDGVVGYIEIHDQAVDTAGDYVQYYIVNDIKYGHILDPFSGFPPQGETSCSVVTDNPAMADALATGIFAMGLDKGLKMLAMIPGVDGLIIDSGGGMHSFRGFEKMFTLDNR